MPSFLCVPQNSAFLLPSTPKSGTLGALWVGTFLADDVDHAFLRVVGAEFHLLAAGYAE